MRFDEGLPFWPKLLHLLKPYDARGRILGSAEAQERDSQCPKEPAAAKERWDGLPLNKKAIALRLKEFAESLDKSTHESILRDFKRDGKLSGIIDGEGPRLKAFDRSVSPNRNSGLLSGMIGVDLAPGVSESEVKFWPTEAADKKSPEREALINTLVTLERARGHLRGAALHMDRVQSVIAINQINISIEEIKEVLK